MATYMSRYKGYTFVVRPKKFVGRSDTNVEDFGKEAKFVDGKFSTEDEEIIKKLDNFAKKHPDEVKRVDGAIKEMDRIKKAIKDSEENVKKEIKD